MLQPGTVHPAGFLINYRGTRVEYGAFILNYKMDI